MITSDFYIQQIFTMITCGCIKKDVAWGIIGKGGTTDGTYGAVQPNIDNRSMVQKNFIITHAYPQLHISDCSTTQKNKH